MQGGGEGQEDQVAREPEIRQQLRHSRSQGLFPRHQSIAQRHKFKWSPGVHTRGNWMSTERLLLKAIIYSPAEKGAEHVFTNSRRSGPREKAAGLPVAKHPAREVVLTAGSKTGRLLFLRSGAVEVIKDGVQIANVSAPGSVFGEQAVLLDQPHTADVRTLEQSEFYVADAPAILAGDPSVALYVAAILARPPTDRLSRLSVSSKPENLPT